MFAIVHVEIKHYVDYKISDVYLVVYKHCVEDEGELRYIYIYEYFKQTKEIISSVPVLLNE